MVDGPAGYVVAFVVSFSDVTSGAHADVRGFAGYKTESEGSESTYVRNQLVSRATGLRRCAHLSVSHRCLFRRRTYG
jgi:hypothetical protein